MQLSINIGLGVFLVDKEDNCKVLPIYISGEQSLAIVERLENKAKRPMTYDLLKNIFDEIEVVVKEVRIVGLKEGTYYGELMLEKEGKIFKIDSRPSDGIAIGLKTGSKVYVKEELMWEQGVNVCEKEGKKKEEIKEAL